MAAPQQELCLHYQLLLSFVISSQDFVLLSQFVSVCKKWKNSAFNALSLGPNNTLQMQYLANAKTFSIALTATMKTMWSDRVFKGGQTQDQIGVLIQGGVEHIVDGLKAHWYSRLAVMECLKKLHVINSLLDVCKIHKGIAARRITWTLLSLLCAYPNDYLLGYKVMCQIRHFWGFYPGMKKLFPGVWVMDPRDTVVLCAAQLPRAVALIDAYLATWPSTAAIRVDHTFRKMRSHSLEVREWIVAGSLLHMEAHAV
jgi:hypothetical protein